MTKLPRIPEIWNDPAAPDSGLNHGPGGLLGGWQSPDWSLGNSGLGLALHPDTIAQIGSEVSLLLEKAFRGSDELRGKRARRRR